MAATIVVGTNSWVTEAEANTWMEGRIHAGDYWVDGAADNVPALITAYYWLTDTPAFSFPTVVTAAMKRIQYEMALFLLQHQPDIDLRMGLQAQGVSEAGIVKEKYGMEIAGIPLPPAVADLVKAFRTRHPLALVDLERDEEQLTSYDAVTNTDREGA